MRTLNRPMFRYGGPIKEGVMDGIREPKRNGGAMGTRQAALVGNPVYPQTAGREHHKVNVVKNVLGVGTKGAAAKPGFITSQLSKLKDTKIVDRLKNFIIKTLQKFQNILQPMVVSCIHKHLCYKGQCSLLKPILNKQLRE